MKVLTFGTFDNLHPGHHSYINQARTRGEVFIIVARDAHVAEIKGHAPDQLEEERLEAVTLAFPDATVQLGDQTDYLEPVRTIQPDLIFLGYDQKLPPNVVEADLPCQVERAEPFKPEVHKSSLNRDRFS